MIAFDSRRITAVAANREEGEGILLETPGAKIKNAASTMARQRRIPERHNLRSRSIPFLTLRKLLGSGSLERIQLHCNCIRGPRDMMSASEGGGGS